MCLQERRSPRPASDIILRSLSGVIHSVLSFGLSFFLATVLLHLIYARDEEIFRRVCVCNPAIERRNIYLATKIWNMPYPNSHSADRYLAGVEMEHFAPKEVRL